MEVDHIGYAVKDMGKAMEAFKDLGFSFDNVVDDKNRNLKIVFGDNGGCRVELIQPLDKKIKSPVDSYLSKIGPTAYHFCYRSDDIDKDISDLEGRGFKIVAPPTSAVAFGGRPVVFMYNISVGLIEIVEKDVYNVSNQ